MNGNGIPTDRPLWRRLALPASVILNLFLLAVIGGHVWRLHNGPSGLALARVLSRAEEILPAADATAFGTVMRRDAPQFAAEAMQLRATRQELDRQIVAEHFDPVAARRALAGTMTAWNQFIDKFGDPLVDALSQVSPEGRRKLINESAFGVRATPP